MSADRQFQRHAAKMARNDAKKAFDRAVREAGRVEAGIKKTVNSLPMHHRLTIALQIIGRRWA